MCAALKTLSAASNDIELRALCNLLRRAQSFTLAFARVNHASLKLSLISQIPAILPALTIAEVHLGRKSKKSIIDQISAAVSNVAPHAVFVHGLSAAFDVGVDRSPAIDNLNLNRDYLAKRFPLPFVFWVRDFELREFIRRVPDFWAWRSSSFRFVGSDEDAKSSITAIQNDFDWSLNRHEKDERMESLSNVIRELEAGAAPNAVLIAKAKYLLGCAHDFKGESDQALANWYEAIGLYEKIGDERECAACFLKIGDVKLRLARYEESCRAYGRAEELYQSCGNQSGQAACALKLGDVAREQGERSKAKAQYQTALASYRRQRSRAGEASCALALGELAAEIGRREEAELWYSQGLKILQEVGDRRGEARCIRKGGDLALSAGDVRDAKRQYNAALTLFRDIGDLWGQGGCLTSMAEISFNYGDFADASKLYGSVIPVHQRLGYRSQQATALLRFGQCLANLKNYGEAESAYKEALAVIIEIGGGPRRSEQAICLESLGFVAAQQKRGLEAANFYLQALPLFRGACLRKEDCFRVGSTGHQTRCADACLVRDEARCLRRLGAMFAGMTAYEQAALHLETAAELYRRLADRQGEASCLEEVGLMRQKRGDTGGALRAYERTLSMYRSIADRKGEADCLRFCADLAGARGRIERAHALLRDARRIYLTLHDRSGEASVLCSLALIEKLDNRFGPAKVQYERALVIYRQLHDREKEGDVLYSLGELGREMEDIDTVATAFHQAAIVYSGANLPEKAERARKQSAIGLNQGGVDDLRNSV